VAAATVEVLEHLGVEVVFPEGQTCCGQPAFNGGDWVASRKVVRHTVRTFAGPEPVVVPSGSCAAMMFHGAILEFGVGALPDSVCGFLRDRKNLRVHSGTIGDGVADLVQGGAVREVDCAMLIGSRKLFDFARDNPRIRLRSCEYTHSAAILGGLERFVAINSAIEVDLRGQVNSEIASGSYVGAIGGAPDFINAASASLVLIPASRLVARLSGPVSTGDAGIVVTEHGAADLRGCGEEERARRLRAIASAHSAV
jgi:acetyl-CoA hydrolase